MSAEYNDDFHYLLTQAYEWFKFDVLWFTLTSKYANCWMYSKYAE